jgi:thiopeptide-type bacteriocin biosynthesis protein
MNRSINFVWGNLMQLFTFFPRVCYKQIIVSPAMWILNASVFKSFAAGSENTLAFAARLQREFKLPRKVLHTEGDNELLVDFANAISVETWVSLIKNKPSVLLKEFLWAEAVPDNRHLHQYIATLVNREKRTFPHPIPPHGVDSATAVTRDFALGSQWLYVKMYCGPGSVDVLLSKLIAPEIELLQEQGLISEWFFIKYRDPEFHIRLRVRLCREEDALLVYKHITGNVAASPLHSLLWKIQLDTYSREIERYGANTIGVCETLFWVDSQAATKLLGIFINDKNEVLKTLWGLRLTDEVLNACGFSLRQKREFVEHARKSFQREFETNKSSLDSINAKYSTYKNLLKTIMGEEVESHHPLIARIVQQKTTEMTPLLAELVRVRDEGRLQTDFFQLISSIIHMMLNRLITQKERVHEMLVYEFLAKFYTTQYFISKQADRVPVTD